LWIAVASCIPPCCWVASRVPYSAAQDGNLCGVRTRFIPRTFSACSVLVLAGLAACFQRFLETENKPCWNPRHEADLQFIGQAVGVMFCLRRSRGTQASVQDVAVFRCRGADDDRMGVGSSGRPGGDEKMGKLAENRTGSAAYLFARERCDNGRLRRK